VVEHNVKQSENISHRRGRRAPDLGRYRLDIEQ
jgi:hypothetical protein